MILAGERLAEVPGALTAAAALADATGARLAWIPRRAGERGAIEAGALPICCPAAAGHRPGRAGRGRPDLGGGVAARRPRPGHRRRSWPTRPRARSAPWSSRAWTRPTCPTPRRRSQALEATPFLVSLELRASAVTDRADVVLPVAAVAEKAGTFVNWEGRPGSFGPALAVPAVQTDLQVLAAIADEMDVHLGLPDAAAARRELNAAGAVPGRPGPTQARGLGASVRRHGQLGRAHPGAGQAVLATWHNLLDAGRMQDGEPNLAGTARAAVAQMSAATAAEAGVARRR